MTNEDRQSEQFIREVDEEFRRAQMKSLWDRFAPLIIAACVLVVLITAGYRGWLWWQEREAARAGDLYLAAVEQLQAGNRAEGEAALGELAAAGGGYGVLARLRLAGDKAASGDGAAAMSMFDAIAADTTAAADMRDLARLRAGLLALDSGDLSGATSRAQPLAVSGNPWRHAAREVLGTAAFASGDMVEARTNFQAIQEDAEAPPDLRSRAALMMTLIEGQSDATPVAASPAAAPAANAAPAEALPIPAEAPPAATEPASAPASATPAASPAAAPGAGAAAPPPATTTPEAPAPATIPTLPSSSGSEPSQPTPTSAGQPAPQ